MIGSSLPLIQYAVGVSTAFAVCGFIAFEVSAAKPATATKPIAAKGIVTDSQNRPLAGALVYFIETSLLNTQSAMTASGILDGSTESFDEPLEDIIRDPAKAATLLKATTNRSGKFNIKGLKSSLKYFAFVMPDAKDPDHLPGGDLSRISFAPNAVSRSGLHIKVSWKTPADATYIGTSSCYVCHDKSNFKHHAHQLGLQVPGQRTANQDIAAHPSWDEFLAKFTEATTFSAKGVKVLFYEDYNAAESFDKFKVFEDATGGGKIFLKVFLWKTAGSFKVTLVNQLNAKDPALTLNVRMTYGGALYRQLCLVDAPGRNGRYPFLQFQAFSDQRSSGRNTIYDSTRRVFRDYGGGTFYAAGADGKFGTADDVLTLPPLTETFEGQCAGCHFTGNKLYKDPATQELLASAAVDTNGAFSPDNSGQPQEVNVGCEACHGPGSRHREEALKTIVGTNAKAKTNYKAKYIVQPALLGADRSSMICGRCHEQVLGNSLLGAREVPLNSAEEFPLPGISRAEFLGQYTSRKSFPIDGLWPDKFHPKLHRAQYSTYLKSRHARNERQMLACDDCHDSHADSTFTRFLVDDPKDPDSRLCQRCHAIDVATHSTAQTGDVMLGSAMACIDCHMPRTARNGAGRPGQVLAIPKGNATDVNVYYWENDVVSHAMVVPRKFSAAGVAPGLAMPVPYTNSCGTCHDASKLQFQQPQSGSAGGSHP